MYKLEARGFNKIFERRVADLLNRKQPVLVLADDAKLAASVFVPCDRCAKVARIRKTVSA